MGVRIFKFISEIMEITTIIVETFIYYEIYFHIMTLDEKDLLILEKLTKPHKKYLKDLAQELRLPLTTVHNRIKKLEKDNIIQGYIAFVDYEKAGKTALAFLLIKTSIYLESPEKRVDIEKLVNKLSAVDGVEEAYIITGDWDIMLKMRSETVRKLHSTIIRNIRYIDGVAATRTIVALPPL